MMLMNNRSENSHHPPRRTNRTKSKNQPEQKQLKQESQQDREQHRECKQVKPTMEGDCDFFFSEKADKMLLMSPASTCSTACPMTPSGELGRWSRANSIQELADDDSDDEVLQGWPLWSWAPDGEVSKLSSETPVSK
eukprot:CAMPEP_0183441716 /NCGR_PEP_ID=MMETSP0370-20130417/85689_1 /TAXON_ID=268820 /ORGANISM="Peridinium aciculiferum, Strain PAER-2" /LENGTH=136 /DNA_ID=CAMNT_0025631015 /DNA_START=127 /DNA_END=537 /DNA_ORIENTATION=-